MKLNNIGFTMVELLVAMAIMGLLVIMAFPTIRAIQTNNTETKYEEYGKAVVSAAKLYVDSYGADVFDSSNNQKKSINLDQLIKKDLIKDINVSESTCIDGSSVNVIKYKDDYTYCLNLICKAKGTNKEVYKKVSQEGQCKDLELYKVYYKTIDNALLKTVSEIAGNDHKVLSAGEAGFNIAGHEFKYWNNGSNRVYAGSKIEVNGNITLVAYSETCPYTITYKSALGGVTGGISPNNCFYGQPCKLNANGYSKDYYKFKNYVYNSVSYSPGKDMNGIITPPANCSTTTVKNYDVTVAFEKNQVTTSYYSNGGTLVPSNSQSCPEYAGCSRSQCVWPQDSKCKGKTGLVFTNTYNFDATGMSVNGVRDYTSAGSLAMTRSGCTQTGKWLVDSATSSTKIIQSEKFATAKDYVNKAGKGTAFKTGNVSISLIAEWDCPSAITCPAGKYLPANKTTCATCTAGNYCVGGTFYKKSTNQGLSPCPNGYKNSAAGSKKIGDCYIKVSCGKYIKTKNSTTQTNCAAGTFNTAHNVNYGSTSSCKSCPGGYGNSPAASCSNSKCFMNVTANRYVKTAGASSSTACPTGYQSSAHKVNYGSTSSCTPRTYTVTIKKAANIKSISLNGSTTTNTSISRTVRYGDTITIGATANNYYHFAKWSDGNTSRSRQIRVTGALTLTATAGKNTITIIYNANGGTLVCSGNTKSCQKTTNCHTKVDHHDVGCTGSKEGDVARVTYAFSDNELRDHGLFDHHKTTIDPTLLMNKNGSNRRATNYWLVGSKNSSRRVSEDKNFPTVQEFAEYVGYSNQIKTNANTEIHLYAEWN